MHKILTTKRIEPYDILETLKKHCKITDYTFDGFSKNEVKKKFLKALETENTFGLYMKNVNKFYLFEGIVDIDSLFGLSSDDYIETENVEEIFNIIDMGKAEAGFIY